MQRIEQILSKYNKKDYQMFYDAVDMLCAKGVAKGNFDNYSVLCDIIEILSICETIIKEK